MQPQSIHCVIPSRLAVGEPFKLKLRVLGEYRLLPFAAGWNLMPPNLRGHFNTSSRVFNGMNLEFYDDCLPEWSGRLDVSGDAALSGPGTIEFDGTKQGALLGDTRPIREIDGFCWTEPGFHFLRVVDPVSGAEGWSNPVYVTPEPPTARLFWGDPHWQTFFSDGLRCPEELYAFARAEAFLDFGAITDHVEAITDRQWDYFVGVTNDFNEPGRFATLVGQEWTKHHPGHRNVYFRGDRGPILRCTDPRYDSLAKLWTALDGLDAVAIPHHSANVVMGVDWDCGWNPDYEKAVEIYSVWGSSEMHAHDGNTRPIHHCKGEMKGRHVKDALAKGYRLGFVGGGDIHDGRPGLSHAGRVFTRDTHPSGLTPAWLPELTREHLFDAICSRQTYATTQSRIYLDVTPVLLDGQWSLEIKAASEHGIREAVIVRGATLDRTVEPGDDSRILETTLELGAMEAGEFCYVRVVTNNGEMAWSSPFWAE